MRRDAFVCRVRPGKLEEYCRLHQQVWPDVLAMIDACHIRNYSIYLHRLPDGSDYLFSYFEYDGSDFQGDLERMAADPATQKWWSVCKPLLEPVTELPPGEVWAPMQSVFYHA